MKKQAFNPYLPSWEYIPDGEPHVFGNRVYIYGSHDYYNGYVFCMGDYVCWSAPVNQLSDWRCEGVIYKKTDDPYNPDGMMCLYAPDVTMGPDGRYYLYYVLDKVPVVSVAVCDEPGGCFKFYGYVHDKDGKLLGEREGDQPQFDPGVLVENNQVYLYTGFCGMGDKSRKGAMATVLEADMLTIKEEPVFVAPGCEYSEGSGFEGHEFFEAPSIRKVDQTYYLIYSSIVMHELCYATSDEPTKNFKYRGVIVSNCDLHIDSYKPAEQPMLYGANNHGSIEKINGEWYIFYHRHTNGTWFSRQGCAEKIEIAAQGEIKQVEMTSCGLNQEPLDGKGYYPAYIACNLFNEVPAVYVGGNPDPVCGEGHFPKIMQDGADGTELPGYVGNMRNHATAGYKYFLFNHIHRMKIMTRGYAKGVFEVRTTWDGEVIGELPVEFSNFWVKSEADVAIPDGEHALYLTFKGTGNVSLAGFEFLE